MKQLKQATINKYSVKQICKHLERYQYENSIFLYRFDFQLNSIHKVAYSDHLKLNHFDFECNIHDYYRDEIIDILNNIYAHKAFYFKPKRNDLDNISVYHKHNSFSHHVKHDIFIKLSEEVFYIGDYGNKQKSLCGLSTCHAYLVGYQLRNYKKKSYHKLVKVSYTPSLKKIHSYRDLKQGDIIKLTTNNKVLLVDK